MESFLSAVTVEEAVIPNRAEERHLERKARRMKRNPHRREQYRRAVRRDHSIRRAALVTLDEMLEHSDKTLDGASWPSQKRLAALTGFDRRTVQRHIDELREAGYLDVHRSRPKRDPATGRYVSRKNNRYYFRWPDEPGGGQRISRKARPHLGDADAAITLLGIETPRPSGGGGVSLVGPCAPRKKEPPRWSDEKGCTTCGRTGWIEMDAGTVVRCGCR